MAWTPPTVSDFKEYFFRDFQYAPAGDPDNQNYIIDLDITKAIGEAFANFSPGLYGTNAQVNIVFMYLVAFYLVFDLQNSAKGISSQANFPINSETVGGVSIGFTIPEKYTKSAFLAQYTANGYGMKYLSLVLPFTVGNVGVAFGTTTPT